MTAPPPSPATLRVLLPLPLAEGYDYLPPNDVKGLQPGTIVEVPLAKKQVMGVVWSKGDGKVAVEKLKAVTSLYDLPPLPDATRQFVDWGRAIYREPYRRRS